MPTRKIDQALILMEKVNSLLRDAKEEIRLSGDLVPEVATAPSFDIDAENWPSAVNPNLICSVDSEKDKEDRANGVVELMIEEDLKDKKFLDFGCGEGHTVDVSVNHSTSVSVGYDIVEDLGWADKKGILTTNMATVEENGPYDVIMMFDVLDHVGPFNHPEAPMTILEKAARLLAPNGKIYLRCHPWTSRHATHMYHWKNKAYVHLIYTDEELKSMGIKIGEPTQKVTRPIMTYRSWIDSAGLKMINERIIKEPVEDFFKTSEISKRIANNTNMPHLPEFQMTIQFVDYILSL